MPFLVPARGCPRPCEMTTTTWQLCSHVTARPHVSSGHPRTSARRASGCSHSPCNSPVGRARLPEVASSLSGGLGPQSGLPTPVLCRCDAPHLCPPCLCLEKPGPVRTRGLRRGSGSSRQVPRPAPHLPPGPAPTEAGGEEGRGLTCSGRRTGAPSPSISAWRGWRSAHCPSVKGTGDTRSQGCCRTLVGGHTGRPLRGPQGSAGVLGVSAAQTGGGAVWAPPGQHSRLTQICILGFPIWTRRWA